MMLRRTCFTKAQEVSQRQTRQNSSGYNLDNLVEPHSIRDVGRNFFSNRVVKPWNNLPEHIKSAKTVSVINCETICDNKLMSYLVTSGHK